VARAVSAVLGAKTNKNGVYEGNGYIVGWCVGHLLAPAEPHEYDDKYKKWRYTDLPIIPSEWKYTTNNDTKKQLKILCDLMKRPDVDVIINACDAGREGELIMRLVYEHARCTKKIMRLWINSMEETAIEQGFRSLKDGAAYDNLYQSALCRQKADWAVGLNLSRLFSIIYNARLRVGRVQTPTLAMIVEREAKVGAFVKEPHYTVEITDGRFIAEREKVKDKRTAEGICSDVVGKTAEVTSIQRNEKSTIAPKLYDLTTLQREANRLFGYTASQTLNCVQNLYEQKLCTYPRTDSRYITEDMAAGIPRLVNETAAVLPFSVGDVKANPAQIVNNAKVSDHHAIIPTPAMPKSDLSSLPAAERNILYIIATRLISAVSDKHTYAETVITVEYNDEVFTAKGKTVIQDGWKAVEQAFADSTGKKKKDEEKQLPDLDEGYRFIAKAAVREGFSQPPKHFTEDTLLSAMENAGAEDMPEDAERKGLGTPATRAGIIENLVKSGFLERKEKNLLPTVNGVNLIKVLPELVKSPMLTAEWENHLKRIERGEMTARDFMTAITKFVEGLVKTYNAATDEGKALFPSDRKPGEVVGKCPRCGADVSEAAKGFFCGNASCRFGLFKDNKFFTAKKKMLTKEIAAALLADGRIFIPDLMSEKTGKPYGATVVLDDKSEGYVFFRLEFDKGKESDNERSKEK
jgi:DNA topoisomerase-3